MLRLPVALVVVALLSGCNILYHMDIAQGNIVSPEMVQQLRTGMTRSQVRFVLGTPLITDSFHPERWDYFYSLRRGVETKPQTKMLTVVFKDDMLAGVEGDLAAKLDAKDNPSPAAPGAAASGEKSAEPNTSRAL